jgi:hypothetical protein
MWPQLVDAPIDAEPPEVIHLFTDGSYALLAEQESSSWAVVVFGEDDRGLFHMGHVADKVHLDGPQDVGVDGPSAANAEIATLIQAIKLSLAMGSRKVSLNYGAMVVC